MVPTRNREEVLAGFCLILFGKIIPGLLYETSREAREDFKLCQSRGYFLMSLSFKVIKNDRLRLYLQVLSAEEWVKAENEKLNDPNTVSAEYYDYFMNLTIEEKKREIEIFEKEIAFDELSISSYRSLGDEDLAKTIENRVLSKKIQLKDFKFLIQRENNYLDQPTE
jgi:hypothetical protein